MAYEKNESAPDWYWIDFVSEIASLVDGSYSDVLWFQNFMRSNSPNFELVNVETFISYGPYDYTEPDLGSFIGGTAVFAYRQAVYMKLFAIWAVEV